MMLYTSIEKIKYDSHNWFERLLGGGEGNDNNKDNNELLICLSN